MTLRSKDKHTAPAGSGGFTLLELLVVLAIMIVVAALAVPRFAGVLEQLQFQREVREMASLLRQTRGAAAVDGREKTLVFDWRARTVASPDTPRPHEWSDNIDVQLIVGATDLAQPERIAFHPDGSSSGAQLTLANSKRSYRIDVDWLTGAVQVNE